MILTALTNGIDTNKIFPKQAVKTLLIKSFSVLMKFFYLAVQRDEFSLQQTVKTHTDKMSKEWFQENAIKSNNPQCLHNDT